MEVNTSGRARATDSPKDVAKSPALVLPEATAAAIELLSRRWVLQVLYLLCQGEARFSELVRAVPGVSRRVLTERLRELADAGLVCRVVQDGPPTRITYRLSEQGAALRGAFEHLDAWAAAHHPGSAS